MERGYLATQYQSPQGRVPVDKQAQEKLYSVDSALDSKQLCPWEYWMNLTKLCCMQAEGEGEEGEKLVTAIVLENTL